MPSSPIKQPGDLPKLVADIGHAVEAARALEDHLMRLESRIPGLGNYLADVGTLVFVLEARLLALGRFIPKGNHKVH